MNFRTISQFFMLLSIVFTQESIPFDVSKQFAVPFENNRLLWNFDQSFEKLLIDKSSKNFNNKFTNLTFDDLPQDSVYVKSKFIYEFGDYGFDKLSLGLIKHTNNEELKFVGSKKSFFGQYSEFSNSENPPLSLFYKFDYSKVFENSKIYSSVGYFREESEFIFNLPLYVDSSTNNEFSDFITLTIGNIYKKKNYHFDLKFNHISKYHSLEIAQYSLINKNNLERNRLVAQIHDSNYLDLEIILDNSYFSYENSSDGFSLNSIKITNTNKNFPIGNLEYGIDLIADKVKPYIYYRNILGNIDIIFKSKNQHSMVIMDAYDFDNDGRFQGNGIESWNDLSFTYYFGPKIDLSASIKYVEAKNFVIPLTLDEVFIPEANKYEFVNDDMVSLQANLNIPFKRSSINVNYLYNFYDSLISSNRSHIINFDYLINLLFINDNLGIDSKVSIEYMSKNNSDFSFNYFRNMPVKKNNLYSDDYINVSISSEIAISDVLLTIKLHNALNNFVPHEDYSFNNHEYFNPISSLLTFGIIWEFDD